MKLTLNIWWHSYIYVWGWHHGANPQAVYLFVDLGWLGIDLTIIRSRRLT